MELEYTKLLKLTSREEGPAALLPTQDQFDRFCQGQHSDSSWSPELNILFKNLACPLEMFELGCELNMKSESTSGSEEENREEEE